MLVLEQQQQQQSSTTTYFPQRRDRISRPNRRPLRSAIIETSAVTAAPRPSVSKMVPINDVVAGGLARAASQSTIHPIDTIKVRLQAGIGTKPTPTPSSGKYGVGSGAAPKGLAGATLGVASKASRELSSLYKGVGGAAGGAGLAIGAYFAFYGAAKRMLEDHTELPVSKVAFLAGSIGAVGSSLVKVPAAVCIRSVQANVYPNVFAAARTIVKKAGPRGLFTGYLPTIIEDVPDMAVKFAAYETMRAAHRTFAGKAQDEAAPTADMVIGLVSGAVAAGATTPLDVIKTRMMMDAASRPTMFGAAADVWNANKGAGRVTAFMRGVGPRAFSNGVNSAIFFCFFEGLRAALKRREEAQKRREEEAAAGRTRDAVHTGPDKDLRLSEASLTTSLLEKRTQQSSSSSA